MNEVEIGPFSGPVTSLDAKYIGSHNSADELNARHEDGRLLTRYGYRNLASAQTNYVSTHGMEYIQGYSSASALVEEFVTFERISSFSAGKCRAFSRNVLTGAVTAIRTSAPATVDMTTTGNWRGFSWNDSAYFCNPNDSTASVYRYTIGTPDSLLALTVPPDPTQKLTYSVTYGGNQTPYSQMSWAGTDAADLTVTGSCVTTGVSVDSSGQLVLQHTINSTQQSSWEVDLSGITASTQDWTYNDGFALPVSGGPQFTVDPGSFVLTLTNADGSPKAFTPSYWSIRVLNPGVGWSYVLTFKYQKEDRTLWDNIKKFKLSYKVTTSSGTISNNKMTVGKLTIGGVDVQQPNERLPGQTMRFGYSYYNSSLNLESGVAGTIDIPTSAIQGLQGPGGGDWLGSQVTFTTAATASADKMRFYVMDGNGQWRRVTTQDDATTTFVYRINWTEALQLTAYTPNPYTYTGAITGFAFKGWVVWLYQGGQTNIRHSRVGLPESQYSTNDSPTDPNRGANFSLADNFGDEPLTGFQADDACVIVGNQGIYAQLGNRPVEMTPCKKLPGSFGCPNPYAACRIQSDGQSAVVALAKNGEGLYLYQVASNFDGDSGYRVDELTKGIRPSLVDFLLTPQSLSNFSTAIVSYEPNTDSLWLIVGKRAMRLPRPSLVSDVREWEFYEYGVDSSETIQYVATSVRTRMKWARSNGKFDENEYNTNTGAYITGSSRDGGNAMTAPFWKSKVFTGPRRRILWVQVDKQTAANTPAIQVISDDATASKTYAANKNFVHLGLTNTGKKHQFKLTWTEGDGYYSRIIFYESGPIGDRRRYS